MPLAVHELVLAYKPAIRMLLNEATVPPVAFDLALMFHIEGFRLSIEDGAIQAVRSVAARLGVALAYRGQEICSHRFEEVTLPGHMRFDPAVVV